MRKQIIGQAEPAIEPTGSAWIDIEQHAQVELTSEDPAHPIEAALKPGTGWQAAGPGEQTIRLVFDAPQRIRKIRLAFQGGQYARTQEFALRWSPDGGRSHQPIVRQQYTFSPGGASQQIEEYAVELNDVTALELQIIPDISGGPAPASLAEWRIGA